ncbi:MAG: hypothetical protein ABI721_04370 [Candidatus Dojkabacteria bacterium]
MDVSKYSELNHIFQEIYQAYPSSKDKFKEFFSKFEGTKIKYEDNANYYRLAYAQLWNDQRTELDPRITLNLYYLRKPDELYSYLKLNRPYSLKIIEQKLNISEDFLRNNSYLVTLFIFLHEFGHILHFEKYTQDNRDLMNINVTDFVGGYQWNYGEKPLSQLPIPNKRPSDIEDKEERLKQEEAYRQIEVEAFSDNYAAMVLKPIIT